MEKDEEILQTVQRIERGIYGDPQNKVEGMIDKVERHDKLLLVPSFIMKNPKWAIPAFGAVLFAFFEMGHRGIGWLITLIK